MNESNKTLLDHRLKSFPVVKQQSKSYNLVLSCCQSTQKNAKPNTDLMRSLQHWPGVGCLWALYSSGDWQASWVCYSPGILGNAGDIGPNAGTSQSPTCLSNQEQEPVTEQSPE